MEEENREYKIQVNDIITIEKTIVNGHTFYKTVFIKRTNRGPDISLEKFLSFPKEVDLDDGTTIRVKALHEDGYRPKNNKYVTIWTVVIDDFDIVQETSQAIIDFNKKILDTDDLILF